MDTNAAADGVARSQSAPEHVRTSPLTGTAASLPIDLPDPAGLAEEQVRGQRCVWCVVSISTTTAVDLGPRETDAHGSGARWFPRSCRPCAYKHFCEAFEQHRKNCKQCATSLPWCVTGQRLFGAAVRIRRQGL